MRMPAPRRLCRPPSCRYRLGYRDAHIRVKGSIHDMEARAPAPLPGPLCRYRLGCRDVYIGLYQGHKVEARYAAAREPSMSPRVIAKWSCILLQSMA